MCYGRGLLGSAHLVCKEDMLGVLLHRPVVLLLDPLEQEHKAVYRAAHSMIPCLHSVMSDLRCCSSSHAARTTGDVPTTQQRCHCPGMQVCGASSASSPELEQGVQVCGPQLLYLQIQGGGGGMGRVCSSEKPMWPSNVGIIRFPLHCSV
jgi:hypothetical protein